jgi:predicted RND superfamily exporter protein
MRADRGRWRARLIGAWGTWTARNWGKALLIALAITAALGLGLSRLSLELTYYSMMPKGSVKVRDLKKIIEEFPAASSIVVVLEAGDTSDREQAQQTVTTAVDFLEHELSRPEYAGSITRVQGRLDLDFIRNHGLLLTKTQDIRRLRRIFTDLNLVPLVTHLNDDFEREYSGNEQKLADEEQQAAAQLAGLAEILALMNRASAGGDSQAIDRQELSPALDLFLFGSPYFLNRDGTMALLFVQPAFTINDLDRFVTEIPRLERAIKSKARSLGVEAGLTGLLVVSKDEMLTSEQGLGVSMAVAVLLILLLMVVSFRMYSVPLISGIPLLTGILWTAGLAGWVMGRLNIVSAMYMVALVGLGIDYAIHLLTTYVQEREDGLGVVEAVGSSMRKSGSGILIGAFTTAIAFFALTAADSEMVKELGVVAGLGILCELAAMFIMVPALLGLRGSRLARKGKDESGLLERAGLRYGWVSALGKCVTGRPALFAAVMLAAGTLLATQAGRVRVEGNIMNMEAKGLESIELQDRMVEEFGMAPDILSITGRDRQQMRVLVDRIDELESVKAVESIFDYFPSPEQQAERAWEVRLFLQGLGNLAADGTLDGEQFLAELERLDDNLLEMSDLAFAGGLDKLLDKANILTGRNTDGEKVAETDLDRLSAGLANNAPGQAAGLAVFQQLFVPALKDKLLRLADSEPITLDMIPADIRDSYLSRDGKDFLINIIPTRNPWDEEYRRILKAQVATITDRATGMVLSADQMTEIARHDGIRAAAAALLAIFALLLLDFRNIKLALVTLLPLCLSFLSLFGFMGLAGIKFDFVNIIAVPLLIGIGVDDALHFNHRYLLEGKGNMPLVISRTGTAVLLTSLTTIIGFASFIPSIMRAMRSTGIVLSAAMALAYLFSVLFHPAVLIIVAEKLGLNIHPWTFRRNT